MAKRLAEIWELILARFGDAVRSTVTLVTEEEEREDTRRTVARQRREERLAARGIAPVIVRRPAAVPDTEQIARRRNRLVAVVDAAPVLYRDVPLDAWYSPFVSYLIEEDIAQGYRTEEGTPTGEFGVTQPVTYAEILKMGLEATRATYDEGRVRPRNASAAGTWAAPYVAQAEARHVPVLSPTLDVHAPATRAETVALLLALLDVPVAGNRRATFADVAARHPYGAAIATAAFFGLVEGNPDGTFRPDEAINRAEAAKLVALLVGLREE
jgi:hypothetical protein